MKKAKLRNNFQLAINIDFKSTSVSDPRDDQVQGKTFIYCKSVKMWVKRQAIFCRSSEKYAVRRIFTSTVI